jgi:hypothetical protein
VSGAAARMGTTAARRRIRWPRFSSSRCSSLGGRRGIDGLLVSSCGRRGGGGDHGLDFCPPASSLPRRRPLHRLREACEVGSRSSGSLGEVGGCCCGRRSAGEGSGFLRRDVLAWPDPGWMELGVSPRLLVVLRQDPSPRRWWLLRLVFAFGHGAHPAPRVCHLGAVLLHRLYRRWRTLVSGGNKEDDGSTAIASVSSLFFSSCICNRTCTVFLLG